MRNTIYVVALWGVSLLACNEPGKQQAATTQNSMLVEKADWLIGEWRNITSDGLSIERWSRKDTHSFSGVSYYIAGTDTVSSETIVLEERDSNLFYIPTVKENNYQPVTFALAGSSEGRLVFENPTHDFPQVIAYTRINADSLVAEISGMINGQEQKQLFPMKRLK